MPTPSNSGVQNTIEMNAVDVRVDEEVNAATQQWDHRVISTILGIIETDAFHMWQHFHPQGKDYSHADFTEEVAYHLLTSEEPSASEALDSTLLEPPSQITSCIST